MTDSKTPQTKAEAIEQLVKQDAMHFGGFEDALRERHDRALDFAGALLVLAERASGRGEVDSCAELREVAWSSCVHQVGSENVETAKEHRAIVVERLARVVAVPTGEVRRCSLQHAQWLGMSASVAGGFVLVDIDASEALQRLVRGRDYLSRSTTLSTHGDGDPVDRGECIRALRAELEVDAARPHMMVMAWEHVRAKLGMLDLLEGIA